MGIQEKELDKSELDNRLFEGFAATARRNYVCIRNIDTGVSRWSKNAVEEFALPGEYMENAFAEIEERVHPDEKERYKKEIKELFESPSSNRTSDYHIRNRYGEYVRCTLNGKVIPGDENHATLFVTTVENHSIMDNVDPVTNLYNIYEFWQVVKKAKREKEELTVLLLCINNFSEINETYGYDFGNAVLREFGGRLKAIIGTQAPVFRMDGVQFACCFKDCDTEEVKAIYLEIQRQARHQVYVNDVRIAISISGGAAIYNDAYDEYSIQTSTRYALEQSKHKRHGNLVFFDYAVLEDKKNNLLLMKTIRDSIMDKCDGFYLVYQPVIDARQEKVVGAETLLRWKKEPHGEIPPGVFLPWLENDPRFWELGNWILRTSMTEGKEFLKYQPDFTLNVNVAYTQLSRNSFVEVLRTILEETEFPAQNLCLELTERCRQLEKDYLKSMIDRIKELGVRIAIDDFGTGFSSLSLLGDLSIDTLKIDRGFVSDIKDNYANQSIVKAITGCAQDMEVKVCVEGVEDREIIDFIKQYPVHSFQGYYFSRPISRKVFMHEYYNVEI